MLVVLGTAVTWAAPPSRGLLIVLNKSDNEAALVDPETYQVIAKVPTGRGPHEVAASPDGKRAYVANYGAFRVFQQGEKPEMEPGNTITVIDLERHEVSATIRLGSFKVPHGIRVSSDGRRVWVTCEGAQAVLELDAESGKIVQAWKTNRKASHMVVPTPDEKKLYVANIESGSVSVIDRMKPAMGAPVPEIPTGAGAEGIDISPDGREVWVANRGDNTISVIDTASDKVVASFPSGGKIPIRLKFTPDGKQVWVSNAESNSMGIFDAGERKAVATMEVGQVPVGMVMSPEGSRVFVATTNANQVAVIDTATRKIVGRFSPGNEPDGIAWAGR